MMRETEFDRILTDWLSDGPERAPARDVAAALAVVASTPQRRTAMVRLRAVTARPRSTSRLVVLVAALLAAAIGFAIGVGSGLIRPPMDRQLAPEAVTSEVEIRPIRIEDWAVQLSIPASWEEVDPRCCDFRQFGGVSPAGHVSVGHESPYTSSVCDPTCHAIEVPGTIPYSPTAQRGALKRAVEAIAGSADWTPVTVGILSQVVGAEQLETRVADQDGWPWRRIHIVGLHERNLVTIAWSQPEDSWDPDLRDAVLASIELTPAPVYSDGDLVEFSSDDFGMRMPGLWATESQPNVDGEPLSGVRRFHDGRISVSIGDTEGEIGLCDPDCRVLTGQTSLDVLEQSIRDRHDLEPMLPVTLGGATARSLITRGPPEQRYVVSLHDGRPVILMLDAGTWDVGPGVFDEMIASYRFIDPAAGPAVQTFTTPDGRVELQLTEEWHESKVHSGRFTLSFSRSRDQQELTVTAGATDGSIRTCHEPAGPWEVCRDIVATTLDELRDAVQPAPVADHGVGPPGATSDNVDVGGEPGVITRIRAYEYPARGGQEVVYIVALNDGRPYIIRIWTSRNEVAGLDSVIAGVRFLD